MAGGKAESELDFLQDFGARRPALTAGIVVMVLVVLGSVGISASWRFFAVIPLALAAGAFVYWISIRNGRRNHGNSSSQ